MSVILTDAVGNPLQQNNNIAFFLQRPNILVGKILNINHGGINVPTTSGKNKITRGMIMLGFQLPILFDPLPVVTMQEIYRIIDPASQSLVEEAMDNDSPASGRPAIVP